jgi:hypothetical protein
MAMQREQYDTMEGHVLPMIRQLSVFLENRPGELLRLTQAFEDQEIKILGLSQMDVGDCAIVRLVFDKTDLALTLLKAAEFPVSVSEIIVVRLPAGKRAMMQIWSVLLMAECNVSYTYPLLSLTAGPCLALSVDSVELALDTLIRRNFEVLGEADLQG